MQPFSCAVRISSLISDGAIWPDAKFIFIIYKWILLQLNCIPGILNVCLILFISGLNKVFVLIAVFPAVSVQRLEISAHWLNDKIQLWTALALLENPICQPLVLPSLFMVCLIDWSIDIWLKEYWFCGWTTKFLAARCYVIEGCVSEIPRNS